MAEPMTSPGAGGARARILAAATDQVVRQGVRRLRVEQLAREAGVAPSLLYYHFGNRAGLVRAVLHGSGGAPAAPATMAADLTGRERVVAALLASLDDDPGTRDTGVLRSEAIASAAFDAELRPDLEQRTGEWHETIEVLIAGGRDDGSIAAAVDAAALARQLTALVDGVRERWLADVIELERARAIVESAAAALLPPGTS